MGTVADQQIGEPTVASVKTKVQEISARQQESQKNKTTLTPWQKATIIALAILSADIACLWYSKESLAFAIGSLGIVTFFGILILSSHYKKNNPKEDVGAVRQALAGSLFVVYFAILGISLERPDLLANTNSVLKSIMDNYWAIILSVVAFYFGSQGAQSVAKALKSSSEPSSQEVKPSS